MHALKELYCELIEIVTAEGIHYYNNYLVVSNPGFVFQILSHSFGAWVQG